MLNPDHIREEFPIFHERKGLVFLDSASTTQKPQCVIDSVSTFYSNYNGTVGQAKNDEELLALGTQLYRFGNMKEQIPSCTSCHGVYGQGNSLAGYPSIAGQQVGYLTSTLKAYRSKERNAGESSLVMQSIAENLTDYEIEALANYMHGLYQ